MLCGNLCLDCALRLNAVRVALHLRRDDNLAAIVRSAILMLRFRATAGLRHKRFFLEGLIARTCVLKGHLLQRCCHVRIVRGLAVIVLTLIARSSKCCIPRLRWLGGCLQPSSLLMACSMQGAPTPGWYLRSSWMCRHAIDAIGMRLPRLRAGGSRLLLLVLLLCISRCCSAVCLQVSCIVLHVRWWYPLETLRLLPRGTMHCIACKSAHLMMLGWHGAGLRWAWWRLQVLR